MDFNIIVACTSNGGIGYNGQLPWKCKEDMDYFKAITDNNVVIMGKNTWKSLPYKPLKNRINIVVSSTLQDNRAIICSSLEEALKKVKLHNIYVIGGSKLYEEALRHNYCKTVYLTVINGNYKCDTFFPLDLLKNFTLIETVHGKMCTFKKFIKS